jgi:hypothetical protein
MIFLGILIGFILGLPIGFIKWKKKTVVVEKYTRRGILQKEFSSTDNITGKVSPIIVLIDFMETLEKMKKIDDDPLNIRCCFFFDN